MTARSQGLGGTDNQIQVEELAKRSVAAMIAAVMLVLIVELINSAVEATIDRISLERHPLAKRAKDLGSAAVFISLLNVPVVWLLVLFG